MKRKFFEWSENYVEIFRRSQLLTQIFAFCVALILFLSLAQSIYINVTFQDAIPAANQQAIIKELFVQLLIAMLFAVRFSLLFFNKKIYFWFSQLVWALIYLTLLSQMSSPEFGGCTKNAFPMLGENLSYVFVAYLIFSPLRQIGTLLISFGRFSLK